MTSLDDTAGGTSLLVVGGGGLLGSAVRRRAAAEGFEATTVAVPWDSPVAAADALVGASEQLLSTSDRPWAIAWCAGVGTVGASAEALSTEQTVLRTYLDRLLPLVGRSDAAGALFIASSAGAVYAGAPDPPFTEATPPAPIAAYGEAKLAMEALATSFAASSGVPTLIGRISNLYGPGQDLAKPQGVISHLCRANVMGEALSIYVPLDTIRDYLYVDDAARMILRALRDLADRSAPASASVAAPAPAAAPAIVKILASHQPTTLGSLLGEFRRVIKRRPLIALGSTGGALQPLDLRMRSVVWNDLDTSAATPIAYGLKATMQDIAWRLRLRQI